MGTDPDCDSRLSEYILQHWQNIPSSGMSSSSVTGMVKRRDDELRYVDTRRGLAGLPVRDGLAGDVETLGELSLDHSAGLAVLLDGFTYRHGDSLRRMSRSLQHDSARGVKNAPLRRAVFASKTRGAKLAFRSQSNGLVSMSPQPWYSCPSISRLARGQPSARGCPRAFCLSGGWECRVL